MRISNASVAVRPAPSAGSDPAAKTRRSQIAQGLATNVGARERGIKSGAMMTRRCKKLADKGAHPSPSSSSSHEAEAPEVGNNARSFRQGEQAAPSFRILPLRGEGRGGNGGGEGTAIQIRNRPQSDSRDLFGISKRERYDFAPVRSTTRSGKFVKERERETERGWEGGRRDERRAARRNICTFRDGGLYVLPLFICSVYYLEP